MGEKTFAEKCYSQLKEVPVGYITTYADLAKAIDSRACRAVGQAMGRNTNPKIPCHRVVKSDGTLGGFAWPKKIKIARLQAEGIEVVDDKIINFAQHRWNFMERRRTRI